MADIVFKPCGNELKPLQQPWSELAKDDKVLHQALQSSVAKLTNDFLPRVTNDQWQPCFAQCRGLETCPSKKCRRFREARDKVISFDELMFVAPEFNMPLSMKKLSDIRRVDSTKIVKYYLPDMSHISCDKLTVVAKLGALKLNQLPRHLTKLSLTVLSKCKAIRLPDTVEECVLSFGLYSTAQLRNPGEAYEIAYGRNTQLIIGANSCLKKLSLINLAPFDACPVNLVFEGPASQLTHLTLRSVFTDLPKLFADAANTMPNLGSLELIPPCRGEHLDLLQLPTSLKQVTIYHGWTGFSQVIYPAALESLHLRIDIGDACLDYKVPKNCPQLTKLTISAFMYDWSHTRHFTWPNYTHAQLRRILLPSLEEFGTTGDTIFLYDKHGKLVPLSQEDLIVLPKLKTLRLWSASEFVTLTTTFAFAPSVLQQVILHDKTYGHEVAETEMPYVFEAKDRQQLVDTEVVYMSSNCYGYDHTYVKDTLVTVK
jgi:hypothetical protein